MLEALRRGTGSWVVKILLALLIISFAAWGIGDIFRSGSDVTVAKVGETSISASQYSQAFQRQLLRFQQSGSPITSAQARAFGLDRQVLNSLIARILLDQHALDLGLSVSERQFTDEIRTNPIFHDAFRKYDKFRLRQVLAAMGVSEKEFIATVKSDLRRAKLLELIELVDLVPDALVDNLYRYKNERRVARLVILAYEGVDAGTPTEDALEKFLQERAADFTAPQYRTVSYLSLSPRDLLEEIQVSDDKLREYYENRQAEFVVPEKRSVDQILVDDESTAQTTYNRLQEGASFALVAKEVADLSIADTDLGSLTSNEFLTEDLAAAAFSVIEDAVSVPVQSDLGWHLFRVREIIPGSVQFFDDVKDKLSEQLRLAMATDALYDFTNRIEDKLASGATLEETAQAMSLKFSTAGPFDRKGQNQSGNKDTSLPEDEVFLETAFSSEEGLDSGLVETSDGKYFVLRVDGIVVSALRSIEAVRSELVSRWQLIERARIVRGKADALMEEAKEIMTLARRAEELGHKVRKTAPLRREGELADLALTPAQLSTLFTLNPGDMTSGPTPSGNSYVIAVLEKIIPANPATDPEGKSKLRISIAEEMPGDLLVQYQAGLESEAGVVIYPSAIDSLFSDDS